MILSTIPPAGLSTPEALAGLFNSPHARRARANTAKARIGPGDRPQEVYTPPELVRPMLMVWPHIECDPCSGPDSLIPARVKAHIPLSYITTDKGRIKPVYVGPDHINGLKFAWPNYTYSNPPYAELKAWMLKAMREAGTGPVHTEIMQLVPVRCHRKWWRQVALRSADAICWLDPVKFVGSKSAAPFPLAMLYWGESVSQFRWAFEDECKLGEVDAA